MRRQIISRSCISTLALTNPNLVYPRTTSSWFWHRSWSWAVEGLQTLSRACTYPITAIIGVGCFGFLATSSRATTMARSTPNTVVSASVFLCRFGRIGCTTYSLHFHMSTQITCFMFYWYRRTIRMNGWTKLLGSRDEATSVQRGVRSLRSILRRVGGQSNRYGAWYHNRS